MSILLNPYIAKTKLEHSRIEKYRYNLMRSGQQTDKEWLTRQIMSGRVLYPLFSGDNDSDPEWKKLTTETTRKMYAESLLGYLDKIGEQYEWDMHVEIESLMNDEGQSRFFYKFCPMIRFQDFVIENSSGDERELHELFVFFYLQVVCVKDEKMVLRPSIPEGMRTLFHEDEYSSCYVHSHLTNLQPNNRKESSARQPKTFCIGNDHQEELIALLGANYDPHLFASFLMILRTMVEWESLEGVPYSTIDGISSRDITNEQSAPEMNEDVVTDTLYVIFRRMYQHNISESMDFVIHENHYGVKMTREFEEKIKNLMINSNKYNFVAKRVMGNWVKYDSSRANMYIQDQHDEVFLFRGHEFKLSIYGENHQEDDTNHDDINNYRVYPKFLDYVKQQINTKLYHHQVSRSFPK